MSDENAQKFCPSCLRDWKTGTGWTDYQKLAWMIQGLEEEIARLRRNFGIHMERMLEELSCFQDEQGAK